MTFVLRHPVNEIQFFKFAASPTDDRPIPAGRLVYMSGDRTVENLTNASAQRCVGYLMQKVKDHYTDFPANFMLRSDIGSTDVFVGDPVAVAAGAGAVYETTEYNDTGSDGIAAGTKLYPDDDGKLADTDTASAADGVVAIALNTLTAADTAAGKMLLVLAKL